VSSSTRTAAASAVLAFFFAALHVPFIPPSLEDLDSINFALGARDFDVAQHQPHPPGYPVYIAAAKLLTYAAGSELLALSSLAIIAGAASAFALVALFRALEPGEPEALAATAALAVLAAPLFWVTAARPLSDVPGLALALAVQALTLRAYSARGAVWAALCAGLAVGVRSQIVWLTLPLLAVPLVRLRKVERRRTGATMAAAYSAGVAVWAIPLLALTGGVPGYLRVLASQGAEDFSGVVMLWTSPTPRVLARALYQSLIAPWAQLPLGVAVVVLASVGLAAAVWRRASWVLLLVVAFGPYVVFHLLFQETATTRYALPLVVPLIFLSLYGVRLIWRAAALPLGMGLAAFGLAVSAPQLSRYAQMEAPAFRMLADMREAASGRSPVLAMHRREEFDLRRPIRWVRERMPALMRLPSPPKHEWLELVKYWNGGGRDPVWFVADPLRSDLALFDRRRSVRRYRWPGDLSALLGGVRPNEMDWYVIDRPGWYAGEGWDLTPETAGITREDGRGPGRAPIRAWVRRRAEPVVVMIGGRNLAGPHTRLRVSIDEEPVEGFDEISVPPGFFLQMQTLPSGRLDGPGEYATLAIAADNPQVAIEQFDIAPAEAVVFGFGEGWHEQEYNPRTGLLWRWSSERAVIRVRTARQPLTLRMAGEIEAASTSTLVLRVNDRKIAEQLVGSTFALEAAVPADMMTSNETALVLETSESYVPAEQGRSGDRRRLGVRVFALDLTPASGPGTAPSCRSGC
jgi:hypothetical protein